jgi:cytochrome c-type biogenesis protein CcmH/NrfG
MKQPLKLISTFVLLTVLVAGCVIMRAPVSENAAVVALVDNAHADVGVRRFPNAAATLERALRLEPKNPRLWQELARVYMKQGDYAQAENLAARSNSWAGGDNELRAENWRLIAETRAARGDEEGAQAALERARH